MSVRRDGTAALLCGFALACAGSSPPAAPPEPAALSGGQGRPSASGGDGFDALLRAEGCDACERERAECEAVGGADCGERWSRCRMLCLELAQFPAEPGSDCGPEAPCDPGLCCEERRCVPNDVVYAPDAVPPVTGSTLRCPLPSEPAEGGPAAPLLRVVAFDIARCEGGIEDAEHARCVCRAICRASFRVAAGAERSTTVVRYPFVDVDGLSFEVGGDGTVGWCRYQVLGRLDVEVRCDGDRVRRVDRPALEAP